MSHRTTKALAAATLAAGLFLTACAANPATPGTSPGASEAPSEITIGSMIWNTSVPFYSNFIKGQQETAASLGVKLTIVDGKGDIGTEVAGVQQLIAQGVDAILVTPSDAKGIVPAIKKANEAGIPVFAVNNRVDDTAAEIVTFIGADDVEFGRQQAALVAETLPNGGKIAYMMGGLGTSASCCASRASTRSSPSTRPSRWSPSRPPTGTPPKRSRSPRTGWASTAPASWT